MADGRRGDGHELLLGFDVVVKDLRGQVDQLQRASGLAVRGHEVVLFNLEELVLGDVLDLQVVEHLALLEGFLDFRGVVLVVEETNVLVVEFEHHLAEVVG